MIMKEKRELNTLSSEQPLQLKKKNPKNFEIIYRFSFLALFFYAIQK